MVLFLILINSAGFNEGELEKNVGLKITQPFNKRKPITKAHMKYIDDLSLLHALDLRKSLIENTSTMSGSGPYHSRT